MYSQQTLIDILGGEQSLGCKTEGLLDYHELILKGFSWNTVKHFMAALRISDDFLSQFLGIDHSDFPNHKSSQNRLDQFASDRLYRLAVVVATAAYVHEDPGSGLSWLKKPQVGLNGNVPLDLVFTEPGIRLVENLLGRIEYSVLS